MKEKSRKLSLTALGIFTILAFSLLIAPLNTHAASTQTKARALKAYKQFVSESDYRYFCMMDINKDGLKELVISNDYNSATKTAFQIYIYTYRNGRVCSAGSSYSMFGITRNASSNRLQGSRGGGGGIENWYYTLQAGQLKSISLQAIETGSKNGKMTYNWYYNGKKISKAAYTKKLKQWKKQTRKLTFYKMTSSNVRKYMKM